MASSRNVVAGNIRAEMARRNVTQRSVAEALGLTQQAVSGKLRGRRPLTVDELHTIAGALGIPVARLLEEPVTERAS